MKMGGEGTLSFSFPGETSVTLSRCNLYHFHPKGNDINFSAKRSGEDNDSDRLDFNLLHKVATSGCWLGPAGGAAT